MTKGKNWTTQEVGMLLDAAEKSKARIWVRLLSSFQVETTDSVRIDGTTA
jgi:hypothetical protein